jgi:class 3 adenylate cyclase
MLLDELGGRVRAQREKLHLKQQDIASALQVSPQAVSKWERGENGPDLSTLEPLSRLLGVTVDWLLGVDRHAPHTMEGTVLATSISGAYAKSIALAPVDFAAWANGLFRPLTEAAIRFDGLPIKYMGDAFLCFFTGTDHAERALRATILAREVATENLRIGLSVGDVYMGPVGHPDYARPDIMGEAVNIAFLTRDWAEENTTSGVAASGDAIAAAQGDLAKHGKIHHINFKGISRPVVVAEILI